MLNQTIFTIAIAIIIYVLKGLLDDFFLEPRRRFNQIRGEIAIAIAYYSNVYMDPKINMGLSSEEKEELKNIETPASLRSGVQSASNSFAVRPESSAPCRRI